MTNGEWGAREWFVVREAQVLPMGSKSERTFPGNPKKCLKNRKGHFREIPKSAWKIGKDISGKSQKVLEKGESVACKRESSGMQCVSVMSGQLNACLCD